MNPGFQTKNFRVATQDGQNFVLLEDVFYLAKDGTLYVLPVGMTTDGASTPAMIWLNFPPFGSYWKAAVLHDAAYRDTLMVVVNDTRTYASVTEQLANELLLEAMELLGTHEFTRQAIYDGVCLGGRSSFEMDRKQGRAAFMVYITEAL